MAGAAPMPSGKSGKKALDATINLVPFIDLLSCCIAFLLITAVWTELGLETFDVTPSFAREKKLPAALPLAEGGADLRKRLIGGLEKLLAANDRLGAYAAYLETLRKGTGAPPGASRPRKKKARGR